MKIILASALAVLLFLATQASADTVFYCNNSNNENQDWATVPGDGDAASWARARAACARQGGTGFTVAGPSLNP